MEKTNDFKEQSRLVKYGIYHSVCRGHKLQSATVMSMNCYCCCVVTVLLLLCCCCCGVAELLVSVLYCCRAAAVLFHCCVASDVPVTSVLLSCRLISQSMAQAELHKVALIAIAAG